MPRVLPWLAALLVFLTAAVLVVDLARPGMADPVRATVARWSAPAQAALAGWDESQVRELRAERDELASEVARLRADLRVSEEVRELDAAYVRTLGLPGARVRELLPARVVAFSPVGSPTAGQTITIDAGSRDGVEPDQSVVAAEGLVGRVVRVAPASADVVILGDADVAVGVRYGTGAPDQGSNGDMALGMVHSRAVPGVPARGYGELTLVAAGDSPIEVGDEVITLGSPNHVPYVADLPLGVVTAVDPDRGQLGRTAVVRPHVDMDLLDLVAVVLLREGS